MRQIQEVAQRRLKEQCLDLPEKHRFPMWVDRLELSGINAITENPAATLARLRHALAPLKAKLTVDYLALSERPVVVYGYHRDHLDRVVGYFHAPVIDGDTSAAGRARIIEGFQAGQIPVLVLQLQAAGVGVTLTAARHAVFGEIHWSAVDHRQAEDRLHRIGQEREVLYHYLMVQNSTDELVWDAVLQKGDAIDRLDQAAVDLRDAVVAWRGRCEG